MKPHAARTKQDLIKAIDHYSDWEYLFFYGHRPRQSGVVDRSCLSQWYPAAFHVDGQLYRTAEHFMMAGKARLFRDHDIADLILEATTPKEAKQLGRQVSNFNREVWDQHCCDIVTKGNLAKFNQNPELRAWLLRTGDSILVEASPYDRIWGIGLEANHADAAQPQRWPGRNLLGFCLMDVRAQLSNVR